MHQITAFLNMHKNKQIKLRSHILLVFRHTEETSSRLFNLNHEIAPMVHINSYLKTTAKDGFMS